MKLIEFANKVATKQSALPRENSITDQDINDIKEAINENANINIYSNDELKIGKWDNKDLFRKKIVTDYSNISIDSSSYTCNIDVSSLGATELWVDLSHSWFEGEATQNNVTYKMKLPITTAMINKSTATGLGSNYNDFTILEAITQLFLQIYIGSDRQTFFNGVSNCKLVLTVEYLKS
jgi:hypothetical protein